ncbi:hypothetical protein V1478_006315 [Vespula squamosa]|uniref:Uncharacterized protein n=1 Tax=Vespula squamosa TaxID=30214 RepID=A0ABD2B7H1_VESSQ
MTLYVYRRNCWLFIPCPRNTCKCVNFDINSDCIALVYVIIYCALYNITSKLAMKQVFFSVLLYEVNICTHFSKAYTYVLVRVTILHYTFVWRLIPLLSYFILMVAFLIDFTTIYLTRSLSQYKEALKFIVFTGQG